MAHPPIPPKKPVTTLATPCPTHSRVLFPRVSVSSSIKVSVIKDSIKPTAARITATGAMNRKVSHPIGMSKDTMLGKEPPIEAMSMTTKVSSSSPMTRPLTDTIATSEEGI